MQLMSMQKCELLLIIFNNDQVFSLKSLKHFILIIIKYFMYIRLTYCIVFYAFMLFIILYHGRFIYLKNELVANNYSSL